MSQAIIIDYKGFRNKLRNDENLLEKIENFYSMSLTDINGHLKVDANYRQSILAEEAYVTFTFHLSRSY